MKALLLVFLASIALCIGADFEYTGNFTESQVSSNNWNARGLQVQAVDIDGVYIGVNVVFESFTANKNNKDINGTAGIVAIVTYVVLGGFPTTYLAIFNANYNVDWSGQGGSTFDVAAGGAYIANALIQLEERDPSGNLVNTWSLKWALPINENGLTYTMLETSKPNDSPAYITYYATSNNPDFATFNITITQLVSNVSGIVNGDIALVPGSAESTYAIYNYPYASPSNNLSLVIAVATGSGKISASGQTIVSGDNSVYVSFSREAYIKGVKRQITITGYSNTTVDTFDNPNIQSQISAMYGGRVSAHLVSISFPAGESDIWYDPSIGAGTSVTESDASGDSSSSSSASVLYPVVFLVISAVTLLLVA